MTWAGSTGGACEDKKDALDEKGNSKEKRRWKALFPCLEPRSDLYNPCFRGYAFSACRTSLGITICPLRDKVMVVAMALRDKVKSYELST